MAYILVILTSYIFAPDKIIKEEIVTTYNSHAKCIQGAIETQNNLNRRNDELVKYKVKCFNTGAYFR